MSATKNKGIKIRDDVPIPTKTPPRSYPFDNLEVDQCFIVDCANQKQVKSLRSQTARRNKNDEGRRYVARVVEDDPNKIGVWRVS